MHAVALSGDMGRCASGACGAFVSLSGGRGQADGNISAVGRVLSGAPQGTQVLLDVCASDRRNVSVVEV